LSQWEQKPHLEYNSNKDKWTVRVIAQAGRYCFKITWFIVIRRFLMEGASLNR